MNVSQKSFGVLSTLHMRNSKHRGKMKQPAQSHMKFISIAKEERFSKSEFGPLITRYSVPIFFVCAFFFLLLLVKQNKN